VILHPSPGTFCTHVLHLCPMGDACCSKLYSISSSPLNCMVLDTFTLKSDLSVGGVPFISQIKCARGQQVSITGTSHSKLHSRPLW